VGSEMCISESILYIYILKLDRPGS
jgi:hypothetical protein